MGMWPQTPALNWTRHHIGYAKILSTDIDAPGVLDGSTNEDVRNNFLGLIRRNDPTLSPYS